jgi:hypothetical protein
MNVAFEGRLAPLGRRCILPAATAPDQPASMMPLKVVLARITLHRLSSSGWK